VKVRSSFPRDGQALSADGALFAVAPEYFSHLDMSQRRIDLDQRPELRSGSVDFVVNRDYWVQDDPNVPGSLPRAPTPLHYVFAIDVSWTSIQCGVVAEVTKHLKELLFHDEAEHATSGPHLGRPGLPAGAKVAIVTFDRTVQFYNLKVCISREARSRCSHRLTPPL
jgi:protein transport protein SEC24